MTRNKTQIPSKISHFFAVKKVKLPKALNIYLRPIVYYRSFPDVLKYKEIKMAINNSALMIYGLGQTRHSKCNQRKQVYVFFVVLLKINLLYLLFFIFR